MKMYVRSILHLLFSLRYALRLDIHFCLFIFVLLLVVLLLFVFMYTTKDA